MIEPFYQRDGIAIYHGDCRNILSTMADKSIDLVLTDFPYGVNVEYDEYEDTRENLRYLIADVMPEILRVSKVSLITCGTRNLFLYPEPTWILCWFVPSGTGVNPWGFTCWHPVLAYGQDPYHRNQMGSRPDAWENTDTKKKYLKKRYPCPKPIDFWTQLLLRGSVKDTDLILDPFMGSGTTLRAANNTGRKAIGIDVSKNYCNVAVERLRQRTLFTSQDRI